MGWNQIGLVHVKAVYTTTKCVLSPSVVVDTSTCCSEAHSSSEDDDFLLLCAS